MGKKNKEHYGWADFRKDCTTFGYVYLTLFALCFTVCTIHYINRSTMCGFYMTR